jgi:pyruvate/2-oxoglutarate dehydrogenase complex dihydrolipoamide dehydrogenase (E3) component
MANILKPDLCVIGTGAVALELAQNARQQGLSVVLARSCGAGAGNENPRASLRRAAFVASANRAHALRTADRLGLNAIEPKPNFRAVSQRAADIADSLAPRESGDRLAALGIEVLTDDAHFLDKSRLSCGDVVVQAKAFALATGMDAVIPALPGLDEVPYFTPQTIEENTRKLTHLVVIGGSPAAFELAQAYRRLGSEVTLVPQGGLLPGFDCEQVAILLRALLAEGIAVREDAVVETIIPRKLGIGIALTTAAGGDSLDVSHILLAMDHAPQLDTPLLAQLKLDCDPQRPDQLKLNAYGQTSASRIYALGGAAGEGDSHIAAWQARLLIERLTRKSSGKRDALYLPRYVQTDPPLAQIGDSTNASATGATILRSNFAELEAAIATGAPYGSGKLVVDQKGVVLAAGLVGQGAIEAIAGLVIALSADKTLKSLSKIMLPTSVAGACLQDISNP